jgi:ABC-2 type transport system permease protein
VAEALAATHIYLRLVGARIRADWQYRASFAAFTVSQFFAGFLDFAVILVIFSNVRALSGWSATEVAFLFGVTGTAFSIGDVFVSEVERASFHIKAGSFDRFLLRPIGPLLHLCAHEFALRRAGRVAQGLLVLGIAVARLGLVHHPLKLAMTVVMTATGTAIFGGIWVVTSSIAFWTVETQEVANTFTYGGNYLTQYPLDIYGAWLRRAAMIVPLAFVNYLPALWVLHKPNPLGGPGWLRFASPLAAAATVVVARAVWQAGVRHYRSTGS